MDNAIRSKLLKMLKASDWLGVHEMLERFPQLAIVRNIINLHMMESAPAVAADMVRMGLGDVNYKPFEYSWTSFALCCDEDASIGWGLFQIGDVQLRQRDPEQQVLLVVSASFIGHDALDVVLASGADIDARSDPDDCSLLNRVAELETRSCSACAALVDMQGRTPLSDFMMYPDIARYLVRRGGWLAESACKVLTKGTEEYEARTPRTPDQMGIDIMHMFISLWRELCRDRELYLRSMRDAMLAGHPYSLPVPSSWSTRRLDHVTVSQWSLANDET